MNKLGGTSLDTQGQNILYDREREELQKELSKLLEQESQVEEELSDYLSSLVGGGIIESKDGNKSTQGNNSYESYNISSILKKIEGFDPYFEAMQQDAKKLVSQVEECRGLSERLSSIVRRLDLMQIRSQQALACTEDIINLKDCKNKLIACIEEKDLSQAVGYIRQVHMIEIKAAKVSDDYDIIMEKEKELKELVQQEFNNAITEANIKSVMSLCPLLQTLGLETEARDSFLQFVENSVFIAVSADASSVDGATDAATGYAQALSNVFNSTYLIIQQYLPMVIQGMENSLGDIHFLRRLHKRCEQESGLVLKRYMKFRNIKDTVSSMKLPSSNSNKMQLAPSEIHSVMDELALLIQYCCRYSKYIKHVCKGAESKVRNQKIDNSNNSNNTTNNPNNQIVAVFSSSTEFDKMVDELINKFYMEGEQWLMRGGIKQVLPKNIEDGPKLDECFFVLQKCGLRSIATNNIQAASAVLHFISDLLSSELLNQASEMLFTSVNKIGNTLQDNVNKYKRSILNSGDNNNDTNKSAGLSHGFKSAMTLASSITGTNTETKESVNHDDNNNINDPFGTSATAEAFNVVEYCVRYSDRLNKDITNAGKAIFESDESSSETNNKEILSPNKNNNKTPNAKNSTANKSSEMDKLLLCKEDFDASRLSYSNLLRQGSERITGVAQSLMKDLIITIFGKNGPYGGVKFDEPEFSFDTQPALNSLPKLITTPFETIVGICTFNMSDKNKDMIVGMLADACCERFEHFITQTNFRFPGALKLEEIIRSLSSMFARYSTTPIRGKFSRLREVMIVLTSDSSTSSSIISENFTHLTANEVEAFIALRVDHNNVNK